MRRLRINAPNKDYTGKTCGIKFIDGEAVVDDDMNTVDKSLGRSPQQAVEMLRQDFPDYTVEAIPSSVHAVPDLSRVKGTRANARKAKNKAVAE